MLRDEDGEREDVRTLAHDLGLRGHGDAQHHTPSTFVTAGSRRSHVDALTRAATL